MKLGSDEATERFRAELRAWLEAQQPGAAEMRAEPNLSSAHLPGWARAWQKRLFEAGWLVPGWPPELGGRDATPVQQLVYFEEFARIPVMRSYNIQGLTIVAPSIRDYGDAWQQERFVLPTLRAEIAWCLGMSEPGAGSDLAGLSTRAELRGDHWVVTGQKIWTSGAQHADFCFCFVRTNPQAPKHRGISVLIVDMRSRGLDVRPLPDLTDPARADFNQVYFDGVEVPRQHLVGREGGGWEISTGSLAHERGMLWTTQVARIEQRLEGLVALGAAAGLDGRPRAERRALSRPLGGALDRRSGAQVHGLPRLREGGARPRRAGAFADEAARQRARTGDLPVRGGGAGPRLARPRLGAPRRGRLARELPRLARLPAHVRQHDRGRDLRDPAQHHRAARARAAAELLGREGDVAG